MLCVQGGLTLVGTKTLTLLGGRLLLGGDCKWVRLEKLSSDDDSRLMGIISHPHAGFGALLGAVVDFVVDFRNFVEIQQKLVVGFVKKLVARESSELG
ncbi:hypothetical protein Tco_1390231 [Tanacetum coccineum]